MRTKLKANNINELEITLSMTMSLEDWKLLSKQLDSSYPSWQLSSAITDMILKYDKELSEEIEIKI